MEQNQNTSIFGITIDQTGKYHLGEAAKWAKFLAIFGIIICILIALLGIFFKSIMDYYGSIRYGGDVFGELNGSQMQGATIFIAVVYILIALLYFFPCLFLLRFASKMKNALITNDAQTLNASFQSLKATFRYIGVLTIIMIIIWVLALVAGFFGASSTGNL